MIIPHSFAYLPPQTQLLEFKEDDESITSIESFEHRGIIRQVAPDYHYKHRFFTVFSECTLTHMRISLLPSPSFSQSTAAASRLVDLICENLTLMEMATRHTSTQLIPQVALRRLWPTLLSHIFTGTCY